MKIEFVGKNINLQELFRRIEREFFEKKGFKILEKSGNFRMVLFHPSIQTTMILAIKGTSERFIVEFYPKQASRFLSIISYVGVPFGMGSLLLREIEKREKFDKIEREFLTFLTELVATLTL